jgi:hypothetical protein
MNKVEAFFLVSLIIAVILLSGVLLKDKGLVSITGLGSTTATASVNLSEESSIIVSGSIDFGTGRVNRTQVNATLDSAAGTFVGAELGNANPSNNNWVDPSKWSRYIAVENDGTVNVSVNITADKKASQFMGGTGPEFQLKGIATEAGSCATLNTTYTNVPNSTETPYAICNVLNFAQSNDTFNVSARLVVPSDAISGQKNTTITFSASKV